MDAITNSHSSVLLSTGTFRFSIYIVIAFFSGYNCIAVEVHCGICVSSLLVVDEKTTCPMLSRIQSQVNEMKCNFLSFLNIFCPIQFAQLKPRSKIGCHFENNCLSGRKLNFYIKIHLHNQVYIYSPTSWVHS